MNSNFLQIKAKDTIIGVDKSPGNDILVVIEEPTTRCWISLNEHQAKDLIKKIEEVINK
jgi:hypothetical protein